MTIRFTLMCAMTASAIISGCTSLPNKGSGSDADAFIHTVLASDHTQAYRPPTTLTSNGSGGPSAFDQFVARFFMIGTADSLRGEASGAGGDRLASDDFVMLLLR